MSLFTFSSQKNEPNARVKCKRNVWRESPAWNKSSSSHQKQSYIIIVCVQQIGQLERVKHEWIKTPTHIRFHTLILLVPTPNTFLYLSYLSQRWNIRLVARLWLYLITTLSNTKRLWASRRVSTMLATGLFTVSWQNDKWRLFFFFHMLLWTYMLDLFAILFICSLLCSRTAGNSIDAVEACQSETNPSFFFPSGDHCQKNYSEALMLIDCGRLKLMHTHMHACVHASM